MGTELEECISERKEFFNVMANQEVDLAKEDPFEALKDGITSWGSTMAQWSNEIQTSMHNYFRYNNCELKSLRELDYLRQFSLKRYSEEKKSLAKEKTLLWQRKDLKAWKCEGMQSMPSQDAMFGDMKLAFDYILPEKTRGLGKLREIVDWVGYRELSEVLIFLVKEDSSIYRNFLEFGENVKESLGKGKGNLWDTMGKSYTAFSGSVWVTGDNIDDNVQMGKIKSGINQMSGSIMMMGSIMPKK